MPSAQRPSSSINRKRQPLKSDSIIGSESESSDSEPNENKPFVTDHKEWANLDVSAEIKEIFQYILRYNLKLSVFNNEIKLIPTIIDIHHQKSILITIYNRSYPIIYRPLAILMHFSK